MSKHESVFYSWFGLNNIPLRGCVTFGLHSSMDGHWGGVQFGATLSNAALNIHVKTFPYVMSTSTLNPILCIFHLRHLSFQSLEFLFRPF